MNDLINGTNLLQVYGVLRLIALYALVFVLGLLRARRLLVLQC